MGLYSRLYKSHSPKLWLRLEARIYPNFDGPISGNDTPPKNRPPKGLILLMNPGSPGKQDGWNHVAFTGGPPGIKISGLGTTATNVTKVLLESPRINMAHPNYVTCNRKRWGADDFVTILCLHPVCGEEPKPALDSAIKNRLDACDQIPPILTSIEFVLLGWGNNPDTKMLKSILEWNSVGTLLRQHKNIVGPRNPSISQFPPNCYGFAHPFGVGKDDAWRHQRAQLAECL